MVDIIKFQPNVSYPSTNIQNLRYKSNSQQFNLPGFLSKCYTFPENERINNIHAKYWVDLCQQNPSRLLDVANAPYSLHRKIMNQELSRPCTAAIATRVNAGTKLKHQPSSILNKNTLLAGGGSNIASQTTFHNGDIANSDGLNSLSKIITVKAEPLRPSNSITRSSTNAITSWQKYWASTYAQRRKTIDLNGDLNRKKGLKDPTHFVVIRDSTFNKSKHQLYDDTVSIESNSCSIAKVSTTAAVDKKIVSTQEDDLNGLTNQVSSMELLGSSIAPSSVEAKSSARVSKKSFAIPPPVTDKNEEKNRRKSSSMSASSSLSAGLYIKSVSQIIEEVSHAQNSTIPIATKVFKVSVLSEKKKTVKHPMIRSRSRSKSAEKKLRRIQSASKRKRQMSANRYPSNKSKEISMSIESATAFETKYSSSKWDSPYTGLRFDPPTPPCSPLSYVLSQDTDEDDHLTSFEKSEIFEPNVNVNI